MRACAMRTPTGSPSRRPPEEPRGGGDVAAKPRADGSGWYEPHATVLGAPMCPVPKSPQPRRARSCRGLRALCPTRPANSPHRRARGTCRTRQSAGAAAGQLEGRRGRAPRPPVRGRTAPSLRRWSPPRRPPPQERRRFAAPPLQGRRPAPCVRGAPPRCNASDGIGGGGGRASQGLRYPPFACSRGDGR